MRLSLFVPVALVCCHCHTLPPAADSAPDLRTSAERAEDRSVAVLDSDGDPSCGGVWVAQGAVLTAFHCVRDAGKPEALTALEELLGELDDTSGFTPPEWDPTGNAVEYADHEAKHYSATVDKIDRHSDLALLRVRGERPEHDVAALAMGPIHDGDEIDIVGSFAGLPFTYSRGYVASSRDMLPKVRFKVLQVDGATYFGSSGGGAFDRAGDLVGIMDFVKSAEGAVVPGMGFFVHRDVLREFLAK